MQDEVYDFLKAERERGNHEFFTSKEVWVALGKVFPYVNVNRALVKLYAHNFLEFKMTGKLTDWRRMYRFRL